MLETPHGTNLPRSVAIQAGGRSSRLGEDKGLAQLAGKPLIEHVIARVSGLAEDILITTNNPAGYRTLGFRLASDRQPRAGALEGLRTALAAARGARVLVVACDMPFLSAALLLHLLESPAASPVTIPRWNDHLQPLCAVYSVECLPEVEGLLDSGEQRVQALLGEVSADIVSPETIAQFDPDGLSFFNVNTKDDLAQAEGIYARLSSQAGTSAEAE